MPICPHCQSRGDEIADPCPESDGYFLVGEGEFRSHVQDRWLGRRLGGRFIITALLGTGSMSRVYQAYQREVDRLVALKLFEAHEVPDTEGVDNKDRFVREAKVLAKLAHPNCVTLYDFGDVEDGRFLYIAMEHVAGISLRSAVRRGLKFEALVEVIRQVLLALREAHALEIVHRDLKPENIILSHRQTSNEQIVKVLDFGIAKLLGAQTSHKTRAGRLFGTPAYMSPEQCRGETDVTPASDIYALGCVLYELLTGRIPYDADIPQELVRQHQYEPIPDIEPRRGIDPPEGLEQFVQRCLAKEPEDRFENAAVALGEFEQVVGGSAGGGRLAQGLESIDTDSRRVTVPQTQLSGAKLDPTGDGEGDRRGGQELDARRPEATSRPPTTSRSGPVADHEREKDVGRVTETAAGSSLPGSLAQQVSSRGGLMIAAVVVVAVFCLLLAAYVYVRLSG